jgi:GMP synthase-like glutamine amidotransferase
MNFALIKTDYVNDELIAEHGDLPVMFGRLFETANLHVYEARHRELPDPARYDACLITGSRYSVNDDSDWVHDLLGFLRATIEHDSPTPIIGFCFGHQALAKAMGGDVGKGPRDWNVGVWPVGDLHRHAPVPPGLNALFNHREQVLVAPPQARVLAGSERCPVQVMAIGERALGLQFHPEYTLAYQEALMRVSRGMPAEVLHHALQRNRELHRNDQVAHDWVFELITRRHGGTVRSTGAGAGA